ncbi:general stress protein 26 [Paenibacillus shirakamiensis]|uniref:General stress protein 26 n=1 Tax=Paenibacillus shirakamiensis TaxID=1265935 RepID=A0ABS4JIT1_9BACL|nr:pyridoxamine 5'-phosphate oxidase family protein [Paenibacillus shirakamiensis]MBP2001598.1 general stress protein 26 [Paenibacillus shirakamiensis]
MKPDTGYTTNEANNFWKELLTMDRQQLETKIVKALDENKFGSLATVENNKPKVRYMAFYHEGLNVYLATDRKTHKIDELEQNPQAALLLGFEQGGSGTAVEIEGQVKISSDESLKKKLWNDDFKEYFEGPEDPDYIVIEIHPARIDYSSKEDGQQVWTAKE